MPKIALLLPGQGAQFVGMGKALCDERPEARELFDRANEILGADLKKVCFEGPVEELTKTSWCQPAIYAHSMAALETLRREIHDFRFDACAGLSLGEFTALAAAGAFSFEDGLKTVQRRGQLMQQACEASQGSMAALLGADLSAAQKLCQAADVEIANLNGAGQIVLSGQKDGIARAAAMAKEHGIKRANILQVAGAYHSRLMTPAARGLETWLEGVTLRRPSVPVVANVTAQPHDADQSKRLLVGQVTGTVRWEESIRWLVAWGCTHFVEAGPGEVLANLMKRIEPGAKCVSFGKPDDLPKVKDFYSAMEAEGKPAAV